MARGVGQAGTFRRTTPVPDPPKWATAGKPITRAETEYVRGLTDDTLTGVLRACGMSPFMTRVTVEDRRTQGGEWRIVQELRGGPLS